MKPISEEFKEFGFDTFLIHTILNRMKEIVKQEGKEPKLDFELKHKDKFVVIKTELSYSIAIPYHYIANTYIREIIYRTMKGELPAGELDLRIQTIANSPSFNCFNWVINFTNTRDNFIHEAYEDYHDAVRRLQELYREKLTAILTIPKDLYALMRRYDLLITSIKGIKIYDPSFFKDVRNFMSRLERNIEEFKMKLNLINKA